MPFLRKLEGFHLINYKDMARDFIAKVYNLVFLMILVIIVLIQSEYITN